MLTSDIKYTYVKFIADLIGILAGIGILVILCLSSYAKFDANGTPAFGINITGQSFVFFIILIVIVIFCALCSYILKRIKR